MKRYIYLQHLQKKKPSQANHSRAVYRPNCQKNSDMFAV